MWTIAGEATKVGERVDWDSEAVWTGRNVHKGLLVESTYNSAFTSFALLPRSRPCDPAQIPDLSQDLSTRPSRNRQRPRQWVSVSHSFGVHGDRRVTAASGCLGAGCTPETCSEGESCGHDQGKLRHESERCSGGLERHRLSDALSVRMLS